MGVSFSSSMATPGKPEAKSDTAIGFVEDFARVMASARDIVGLYDPNGRPIYVNKAASDVLDRPEGREPFELIHPEDRERVRAQFNEVVRTKAPDRYQIRVLARDGGDRLLDVQASPVTDSNGHVIAVLAISRDVTNELRDTAALQGVVRTLFEQAPIGIAVTDPEGRFRAVNDRLRDMLGYEWPQLSGMHLADLVHPDDRPRTRELMQDLLAGHIDRFSLDKRMLRPHGEVWWQSCISARVQPPLGGERFVVHLIDDITAQRRAASDLQERTDLLHRIFEYAPLGIALTDENARYVQVNRRFVDMVGYSEEELLHMSGWDLTHPEDRETGRKYRDELFSGRRDNFGWERRYLRKDGSSTWVRNTVALVTGADGAKYAIALIEDVTQRRLTDEAMRITTDRLHALSRRLVEMQETERREIARELHDRVGQTLTAMRINMDMIRMRMEKGGDDEVRRRNDDSIELIESAFKSIENVMYELRPPMLEEYGVVASLQWLARQFSQRTGIPVEVRGDESQRCTPEVELAGYRIAQEALTNVARHSSASRVVITVRHEGEVLLIEDNGKGFDTDDPERLAGYGMITMRERAEAIGGKLDVHSAKGSGTRITLTMPKRPNKP